jgi:hypothetical protein
LYKEGRIILLDAIYILILFYYLSEAGFVAPVEVAFGFSGSILSIAARFLKESSATCIPQEKVEITAIAFRAASNL